MATLISQSSTPLASHLTHDAASHPYAIGNTKSRRKAIEIAVTLLTVASVSILAFAAMSLVIGAAIGIALIRLGVSEAIIWPIIGLTGMIALFVSCKLGIKVWNYETGTKH